MTSAERVVLTRGGWAAEMVPPPALLPRGAGRCTPSACQGHPRCAQPAAAASSPRMLSLPARSEVLQEPGLQAQRLLQRYKSQCISELCASGMCPGCPKLLNIKKFLDVFHLV